MSAKSLFVATPKPERRIGEMRRIPLIPDARALFERLFSERAGEPLEAKLFRVRECQKALDARAKRSARIASHITIAASVCDALHRKRRGHSDGLPLAETQRWRRP